MTDQYYSDTTMPVRSRWRSNPAHRVVPETQAGGIHRLLREIDQDITLLDQSVLAEEASTRVFDMTDVRYSLVACQMRARRTNLAYTKTALLARLGTQFGHRQGVK
jgi:hypothetical protein